MRFLRNNGLTIALFLAFAGSVVGMIWSGWRQQNHELSLHGQALLSLTGYLSDEAFWSALFENWESEWLQMATYVVLTAYLFQKGSSESRDPDKPEKKQVSGSGSWIYDHSLGLALLSLFGLSFAGHFFASLATYNSEAALHGEAALTPLSYMGNAQFWFESFQNWQSEFFSTAMLVVLSIFLRYRGSPESKEVMAANQQTGD
ncbi:hypothetical protein GF108_20655 [Phyllobacterium sp. SYP-B3895]|uniref:DUF6766 family protein n=1 Tax=Phyllobacterium sp. SYP-B3895 TaxID=2663240 RepID=UPI0012996971|nr:DUF6766 family protein [Phyllobacterium sp. SYP-B3895]MRG57981.1 hypothetical protein [Phyllobacterium sp. SYP-B3895]